MNNITSNVHIKNIRYVEFIYLKNQNNCSWFFCYSDEEKSVCAIFNYEFLWQLLSKFHQIICNLI